MKLDETVAFIISHSKLDHFTVTEIRTAYMLIKGDEIGSATKARQFVYAEFEKLEKWGWFKKSVSKKRGLVRYSKTSKFPVEFESSRVFSQLIPVREKHTPESPQHYEQELLRRLKDYKNDLLEGLGEVEEYRMLRENFPTLHDALQPKYNEVRELNSKLLGKIKAIESLVGISRKERNEA